MILGVSGSNFTFLKQ